MDYLWTWADEEMHMLAFGSKYRLFILVEKQPSGVIPPVQDKRSWSVNRRGLPLQQPGERWRHGI